MGSGEAVVKALYGLGWGLAGFAVVIWLVRVWLAMKKPHWLCGGNGCRLCKWQGRKYRSAVAGWLRKGK